MALVVNVFDNLLVVRTIVMFFGVIAVRPNKNKYKKVKDDGLKKKKKE